MAGVVGVDHIYVETRYFDRALKFWTTLGFAAEQEWGENGHRACMLRSRESCVVLAEAGAGERAQGATTHFSIEGAEELNASLLESGDVKVVTPLEPTHWGTRWIRVEDPDGNLYCLELR